MKKLLPSALLALAALGFASAESFAGCFGLIPHHGCCGHCGHCGAKFCVRQYNAFSPVACGSLCLDGVPPSTLAVATAARLRRRHVPGRILRSKLLRPAGLLGMSGQLAGQRRGRPGRCQIGDRLRTRS